MENICHATCCICHETRLDLDVMEKSDGSRICKQCRNNPQKFSISNKMLPVWYEDGVPQYHIPECLSNLSIGEQVLIQMTSPYIPLVHLQKGNFGIKGHVCALPQKIDQICHVLPRLPRDVKVIKMIRAFRSKDGSITTKKYTIHREKVLEALRWLKKHSSVYAEIKISEDNLSWMSTLR